LNNIKQIVIKSPNSAEKDKTSVRKDMDKHNSQIHCTEQRNF
jgi:hypothetical protein